MLLDLIKQVPYKFRKSAYVSYEIYEMINKEILFRISEILNENGITNKFSVDNKTIKKELLRLYPIKSWQIEDITGYNNSKGKLITGNLYKNSLNKLSLLIPDIKNNCDIIENTMKKYGYYLNWNSSLTDEYDMKWINMVFFPLHSETVNNEVKQYRFIYHITNIKNKESILSNGFIPKSEHSEFSYPNRIYFFLTYDSLIEYTYELSKKNSKVKNYTIFTVKTLNLENDFYFDENLSNAVFTESKIDKNTIFSNFDINIHELNK